MKLVNAASPRKPIATIGVLARRLDSGNMDRQYPPEPGGKS